MDSQGLPGFRDLYPDEAALRSYILSVWRDVAERYGFEEYDGPPLEPLDLYTKKSGDEIVGQLYTFEDRGGRAVALRPEMTPTLARMVAARAQGLKKPIRWYSMPQLFRYERPQRGRLREHYQLNMDVIGEAGPLADAELIAAALDVMRAFGLGPRDVRVKISDRRVLRVLLIARGLEAAQVDVALQHIDKSGRAPRDVLRDKLADALSISRDMADRVLAVGDVKGLDAMDAALTKGAKDANAGTDLHKCVAALTAMGLGEFVEVDFSIVRGLAYYTGIVFELFDAGGSLRAICGGGRYDGLLEALGSVNLPAVGFGMGDVVLAEILQTRAEPLVVRSRLDAFLVSVSSDDAPYVWGLAHRLRDLGLAVEFSLRTQPVAKQLKLAAAREAKHALIVGPDERQAEEVVVRHLATGEESRVGADEVLEPSFWTKQAEASPLL